MSHIQLQWPPTHTTNPNSMPSYTQTYKYFFGLLASAYEYLRSIHQKVASFIRTKILGRRPKAWDLYEAEYQTRKRSDWQIYELEFQTHKAEEIRQSMARKARQAKRDRTEAEFQTHHATTPAPFYEEIEKQFKQNCMSPLITFIELPGLPAWKTALMMAKTKEGKLPGPVAMIRPSQLGGIKAAARDLGFDFESANVEFVRYNITPPRTPYGPRDLTKVEDRGDEEWDWEEDSEEKTLRVIRGAEECAREDRKSERMENGIQDLGKIYRNTGFWRIFVQTSALEDERFFDNPKNLSDYYGVQKLEGPTRQTNLELHPALRSTSTSQPLLEYPCPSFSFSSSFTEFDIPPSPSPTSDTNVDVEARWNDAATSNTVCDEVDNSLSLRTVIKGMENLCLAHPENVDLIIREYCYEDTRTLMPIPTLPPLESILLYLLSRGQTPEKIALLLYNLDIDAIYLTTRIAQRVINGIKIPFHWQMNMNVINVVREKCSVVYEWEKDKATDGAGRKIPEFVLEYRKKHEGTRVRYLAQRLWDGYLAYRLCLVNRERGEEELPEKERTGDEEWLERLLTDEEVVGDVEEEEGKKKKKKGKKLWKEKVRKGDEWWLEGLLDEEEPMEEELDEEKEKTKKKKRKKLWKEKILKEKVLPTVLE